MRENRVDLCEVDSSTADLWVGRGVGLQGLQKVADGVSGESGHDVSEDEKVIEEAGLIVIGEGVF